MVEPGNGHDAAGLAVAARHALHEEELVAAFATGSLDDPNGTARAQLLVDRCTACRDLHRDLKAIGGALRASAQFTTATPRDFRLSPEDAVRLGGTVSARGFLARLRSALVGFARPLGASMTALGLVGLIVGSVSMGGLAGAPLRVDTAITGASAEPDIYSGEAQASPAGATAPTAVLQPGATLEDGEDGGGDPRESGGSAGPSPSAWLLGGSLGLLAAGGLLLGLAFRRGRQHRTRT